MVLDFCFFKGVKIVKISRCSWVHRKPLKKVGDIILEGRKEMTCQHKWELGSFGAKPHKTNHSLSKKM